MQSVPDCDTNATRPAFGIDVAMLAFENVALVDPDRPGPMLQSRHGSLTSAELNVPLLTASA